MGLGQLAVACSPQPALTDATNSCPGDSAQVQYTAANHSTELVTITANYWFSTDDTWPQSEIILTDKYYFESSMSGAVVHDSTPLRTLLTRPA